MSLLHKIALSRIKGITPESAALFIETVGSEVEFFNMSVLSLSTRLQISSKVLSDQIRQRALEEAEKELRFIEAHGIKPIFFSDPQYPQRLLQCEDAPVMLYALGNTDLNAPHIISVIGTRNATIYGVNFINRLIADLSSRVPGLLVVSGLALGCDVASHRAALQNGVPTVGVVAHGLDTLYPAENRSVAAKMVASNGMILTDYIHGTPPHRGNFLARNRIVAGLADATIVVESAADRGGALHTARLAFLYDREVFALPGRNSDHYSGGCNKLIKNNTARMIESADDIIEDMQWQTIPADPSVPTENPLFPTLSAQQQQIYDFIASHGEASVNELSAFLAIPVGKLMASLVELEFNNLLLPIPGARYRLA